MTDINEKLSSASTKLVGADPSSGLESNYADVTNAGGLHTNLRDSSGSEITSSSNGVAGNQLLHTKTPDTTTNSTALGALNANVQIDMSGMASVGFQLSAGTFIGTLTAQCSLDGGTTWGQASFFDPSNSTVSSTVTFNSANGLKVLSILPIGGSSHVRVIVTSYTSGTANAIMRASIVSGAAGAVVAAAYGVITNTFVATGNNTATLILSANPNRKYCYISNGSGSQVNIQFGSSTGLSTTTGIPIPAKSFYELKGDNLFTGNIYAYSASNVTLSIAEGTP